MPRPLVAFLLVLPALCAGCGGGLDPDDPLDTLRLGLNAEIGGLDPALAQEAVNSICCLQIYDTLFEYHHLKRPYVLVPGLAARMPIASMTGLVHTFHLRQGIRFHDDPCFPDGKGREMTAHDVVFCWKRLLDPKTASPGTWILDGYIEGMDAFQDECATGEKFRTTYPEVSGLRALDEYTVQIRLAKPYPHLYWVLAMPYTAVYPPEAIAHYGAEFLNHPVGTGPFLIREFNRTQRLVLDRNPTYRTDDRYPASGEPQDRALGLLADAGKPLPFADRLIFTIYKESQPLWLDFLLGRLDRAGVPKDQFDTAIDPDTRELRDDLVRRGITLDKTPSIEVIYTGFNMQDPVLGTRNGERGRAIRRAMSLAFDEAWARKKLYNDRLDSVQGMIVPEFPEYDPSFSNPWKRGPDETREEALARARKILADAGYPGGEGIPTLYHEVQDSVTDDQFFQVFQRDMRQIGIRVEATRVTWQQMISRIDQGDAQMWGLSWTADYPDAQNFLMLFYGPNKAPGPNSSSYVNPAFDALYAKAQGLGPSPERTRLYREMERIVVEDCVWIFKYRRVTYDLLHPWLHNFKRSAMQDRYGKFLRVDGADRATAIEALNEPNLVPVWIVLGLLVVVVGVTLWGARRKVRAW